MKTAERIIFGITHLSATKAIKACGAICLSFCLFFIAGCVQDKLDECPTEIDVAFYSMSPCGTQETLPATSDLRLFLFDENDIFVSSVLTEGAPLSEKGYVSRIPVVQGTFTVVAWAGLETGPFDLEGPVEGVTTKADLLFMLHRTADAAENTDGAQVWFGQSGEVEIAPSQKNIRSVETDIDLQEITNRVNVIITGLDNVDDYEVILESSNGAMNYNGTLAPDKELRHDGIKELNREGMATRLTTLKLVYGHENLLVIKSTDGTSEIFHGDLLDALISKNPNIDLDCDHDFNLVFNLQGGNGTYVTAEILVNGWLVYSYETDV